MSSKTKSAATEEEASPALVPKLRFPGFQDAWEMTPIGEKVDLLSGYPFDGSEISQDSSGVRLLRGINITEGRIRHTLEIDRYYTGETDGLEKFRVRLNDLVIGMDGSKVGKNSSLISDDDADALLIQRVARLRTSSPTLIQFIFQQINSTTFHSYVDQINTSSGIPHISAKQIKDFTIGFPSPAEQQKIAECLSSVDELMAAQARKVDALKTHKEGLMQQLFPREGETQPRLRFPEFQNTGEWNAAPVGTLLMSSPDYGVNAAAVPFSEQLPKYLRITDISEDGRYLPEKQVSVDLEPTDGSYLDEGDIVLARTGASVGKSYQYRKEDGRLVFAGFLIRVKPDSKKLVSTYLANFLTTGQFWKWVAVTSARSGQPGINSTEYSSLAIPLPPSLPEQQRIASCLSGVDALITAETQRLEALKTHKKGLMQQLFPFQDPNL
jgi:type I restriction enzyme S subunit